MFERGFAVVDPDLEVREGAGSILLAQPGFASSVISSFFTQNKEVPGPLGPSPRSTTDLCNNATSNSNFNQKIESCS